MVFKALVFTLTMPDEAAMWGYLTQLDAIAVLNNYVRQAGNTLPVGNIDLVHSIYEHLCQLPSTQKSRFTELAINVARYYVREINAGTIVLTDIFIRRDLSRPITQLQLPEELFIPAKIDESADFRGRLERICRLYHFEIGVKTTGSAS